MRKHISLLILSVLAFFFVYKGNMDITTGTGY